MNRKWRRRLVTGAVALLAASGVAANAAQNGSPPDVPPLSPKAAARAQQQMADLVSRGVFQPGSKVGLPRYDERTGKNEVDPATGKEKLFTWDELHPDADRPPPAGTPIRDSNGNVRGYSDGTK